MANLNFTDFITYYAECNEITKTRAKEEINNFVNAFTCGTYEYGGVDIRGFMKSAVVDVPEKTARNPQNGNEVVIPAHKTVKLKISKKFKNMETNDVEE